MYSLYPKAGTRVGLGTPKTGKINELPKKKKLWTDFDWPPPPPPSPLLSAWPFFIPSLTKAFYWNQFKLCQLRIWFGNWTKEENTKPLWIEGANMFCEAFGTDRLIGFHTKIKMRPTYSCFPAKHWCNWSNIFDKIAPIHSSLTF